MSPLLFAVSMEKSIAGNIEGFRGACSPELQAVLEQLLIFQKEYVEVVSLAEASKSGFNAVDIDALKLMGKAESWALLLAEFNPEAPPAANDFSILWCVCAMLDKSAQYYQQAARYETQPQMRISLASLAQMKSALRRRISGIERVVANQVWKAVGFAPGILAKE